MIAPKKKIENQYVYALLCFVIIIAMSVFIGINYEANDDLGIARCISQSVNGSTIFQHKWLIWALHKFYFLFESINWWTIMSVVAVAIGISALVYALTQTENIYVRMMVFVTISSLSYICMIAQMNFTRTAVVLITGSMALSMLGISCETKRPWIYIISLLMLIWGSAIRQEVALMSIPYFGILAVVLVLDYIRKYKLENGIFIIKRITWIAILCIMIALTILVNKSILTSSEKKFVEYNKARSSVQDYFESLLPYDEHEDKYQNIGVTKTDLSVLGSWISEDTEFFTTEKLSEIGSMKEKKSFADIGKALNNTIKKMVSEDTPLFTLIAVLLLSIICLILRRYRELLIVIATLILTIVLMTWFEYKGRLPERVMFSFMWLCLCTGMLSVQFGNKANSSQQVEKQEDINVRYKKMHCVMITVGCLLIIVVAYTINPSGITPFNDQDIKQTQESQLYDLIDGDKERIYMTTPIATYPEFSYTLGTWGIPDPDYCRNLISLGGWGQRRDYNIQLLESFGINNPMRSLFEMKDAYFVVNDQRTENVLLAYIMEHYDDTINYSKVGEIGNNEIIKYQALIPDDDIKNEEIRNLVGFQIMEDVSGDVLINGLVEGEIERLLCNVSCNGERRTYFLGYGNDFTAKLHDFKATDFNNASLVFFTR